MPEAALQLEQVTKRYAEDVALAGLTLRAEPGEVVGLAGGAGAGKTAAVRIAAGLLDPDEGRVLVSGATGYLPQRRGLPAEVTVLDHLVHVGQLHGLATNAAHRAAEDQITALGLRDLRGTAARDLSGAELDRALLAGALVHGPAVLLLDEPFTADPATLGAAARGHAARGAAVLLATGDLTAAEQFCDRIVIVRDGHAVAAGTVAELRAGGGAQVVVRFRDGAPTWADGIPGIEVVSTEPGRTVLRLADTADDQVVLRLAMAAGPVCGFDSREPTLAELYAPVLLPGALR